MMHAGFARFCRGLCILLLVGFALISWRAVQTKSPTYDEPYHAVAAWVQLWKHDFRFDPQNGALFHYWSALSTGPGALHADFDSPIWRHIPQRNMLQWPWVTQTLYRTSGNDADSFLARQRMMMLILGVALGALIWLWAGKIAGPGAAVIALALYCLDPNFLGHAPLVKNDVFLSLVFLGVSMSLWRAGKHLRWRHLLLLGLLLGAGLTVKFSGLLLLPIILLQFIVRAFLPESWPALGRVFRPAAARLLVALGSMLVIVLIAYVFVWGVYLFRFAPTPDPRITLNIDELAAPSGSTLSAVVWLQDHHAFPQAFLDGFLYQYQAAQQRDGFLFGKVLKSGQWNYFPVAILVKTPLTTLAVGILSIILAVAAWPRRLSADSLWTSLCLLLPPGLFLLLAMYSDVNAGLRHVLPIYPPAFICAAWILVAAARRLPRVGQSGKWIAAVLVIALGAESLGAFPDFISFFNAAAGGSRGGIYILGDSNLDWGQDLKQLAIWQSHHRDAPLYLAYFGLADPAYYGVKAVRLPGAYHGGAALPQPTPPGFIAISATNLQGLWVPADWRAFYAQFLKIQPEQVLGGSIYIYDFPPR